MPLEEAAMEEEKVEVLMKEEKVLSVFIYHIYSYRIVYDKPAGWTAFQ